MNKKRLTAAIIAFVLVVCFGVGATFAFLAASSRPVINTFTIGNVQIELSETTGSDYQLIPGTVVAKDPTLTVLAGSDACWLFFKMDTTAHIEQYVIFAPAEQWIPLEDEPGVYYRLVSPSTENQVFHLLKDNQFQVPDTITEEDLSYLKENHKMTFTGYAVQQSEINTAQEAWQYLSEGKVPDR